MGGMIGGIFGGIGASQAGNTAAAAGDKAAQAALTGYRYATGAGNQYYKPYQDTGLTANNSIAELLGQKPISDATQNGFNNYLNSTGYNFRLQQGTNALTSNAASKGLLNSGGTGKALTEYGQNLSGAYFNNYLQQLTGLSDKGQTATAGITGAGSAGGGAAANALATTGIQQAGAQQAMWSSFGSGISSLMGGIGMMG